MAETQVTLVTGESVPESTVSTVLRTLNLLLAMGRARAVHELAVLCAEPTHRLYGGTGTVLLRVELLEDYNPDTEYGVVQKDIRRVVRAAVVLKRNGASVAAERDIIRES